MYYKFIYEYNGNSKIGEPVGELVSNEGVVVIYQNKLPNAITISAIPTNDIFYSKDEIVCRVVSVSDVTVTVT